VYVLNYPCLFTSNRLPEICSKGGDDCLRTNALAARGAWRSRRLEQWLGCQRAQLYNRFNTKAKDSLETSEHVTVWRRLPKRFCSSCAKALMMGKLCCKFRRLGGQVSSCSNFRAHGIYSLCSKFWAHGIYRLNHISFNVLLLGGTLMHMIVQVHSNGRMHAFETLVLVYTYTRVTLMIWAGNAFKPKRSHFVSSFLAGAAYICVSFNFSRILIAFWHLCAWVHVTACTLDARAANHVCTIRTHTCVTKTHTFAFTRAGCDGLLHDLDLYPGVVLANHGTRPGHEWRQVCVCVCVCVCVDECSYSKYVYICTYVYT